MTDTTIAQVGNNITQSFETRKQICTIKEEKNKCQTTQAKNVEFIAKSSVMELVEMLGSFAWIRSIHLQKNFSQNTSKNHTKFSWFGARIQHGIVEFTPLGQRGKTHQTTEKNLPQH